jgi:hypothetical protein
VSGDLRHRDAPGEVAGAIVDASQHVRVQVDHAVDLGGRR